jgi:CRISPR-associated endonuclease/helicase Cas3
MALWGKRDGERWQTLYGHIRDSLAIAEALTRRPGLIGFCRRHGLDAHRFRQIVGLVVLFHDAGKGTAPFQEALEADRTSWNFPHALAALPLMDMAWRKASFPTLLEEAPILEVLAVAAHHTELHRDLYQNLPEPHKRLSFLPALQEILRRLYEETAPIWGWAAAFPDLPLDELSRRTLGELSKALLRIRERITQQVAGMSMEEQARFRARYVALLAYLKAADKAASRVFAEQARPGENGPLLPFPLPEAELESILPDWPSDAEEGLRSTLPPGGDWFDYQKKLQEASFRWGLVRAPCGRGKTQAALLWFLRRRKLEGLDRLIWTLPTQVTSNAMRERLARMFGEERVGLYHGRSSLEHRERIRARLQQGPEGPAPLDPDPALELEWAREANFWSEVLAYPLVVTTADHLLYSFVHGFPQADFALGMLQGAAVVFDEVHAYDDQMQAELREAMALLRGMGVPHLVMSATLPDPLIQAGRLKDYPLIEDAAGMIRCPFQVLKRAQPLIRNENARLIVNEEVIEEVLDGYRNGAVQFLIVNTVRKAQALYRQLRAFLPPEDCLCLHSRFAYAHRRAKERQVIERLKRPKADRTPFVLVTTQIIEVSLDISADRILSEIAPLDALAQRGGRVNRGGELPHGLLIVFPVDVPHPYDGERLSRSWELLREGPVSYGDLHQWANEVYADLEGGMARLPELFMECTLFGPDPSEVRFDEEHGRRYQPRRIEQPTIDVIPHEIWARLQPDTSSLEFLTPVPLWWLAHSQRKGLDWFYIAERPPSRRPWLICRRPYSEEIGFEVTDIEASASGVLIE